jgi:CRISPR/Cas system-associated protein endoribonuclease Cas2
MNELRVAKVEHAETLGQSLWTMKQVYHCACHRIGQKANQKKHLEQQQKVPRKGTGCCCQIVIKCYPHMPTVLGQYVANHNHELGNGNVIYMRLSGGAWHQMKSLLIQKVDSQEIACASLN